MERAVVASLLQSAHLDRVVSNIGLDLLELRETIIRLDQDMRRRRRGREFLDCCDKIKLD